MHDIANKEVLSAQALGNNWLLIYVEYVNKETNNMYINKQTTVKAGFNPNCIKNLSNVKTTFQNIIHNLVHIYFKYFSNIKTTLKQISIK